MICVAVQFILNYPGRLVANCWITLLYRFDSAGVYCGPVRVMANGQCFCAIALSLKPRWVAIPVLEFFCDDVTSLPEYCGSWSRWAFRWREGAEGTNV